MCLAKETYLHLFLFISAGNVRYIWTSGRKCNFNGCDRPDLQPPNINGWFWSGSGAKIGPTTQRNTGDWSSTGGYGQAQPDNREAAQVSDSCDAVVIVAIRYLQEHRHLALCSFRETTNPACPSSTTSTTMASNGMTSPVTI